MKQTPKQHPPTQGARFADLIAEMFEPRKNNEQKTEEEEKRDKKTA